MLLHPTCLVHHYDPYTHLRRGVYKKFVFCVTKFISRSPVAVLFFCSFLNSNNISFHLETLGKGNDGPRPGRSPPSRRSEVYFFPFLFWAVLEGPRFQSMPFEFELNFLVFLLGFFVSLNFFSLYGNKRWIK